MDYVAQHPTIRERIFAARALFVGRRPSLNVLKGSRSDSVVELEVPRQRLARRRGPDPGILVDFVGHQELPLGLIGCQAKSESLEPIDLHVDDVEDDGPDAVGVGEGLPNHRIRSQFGIEFPAPFASPVLEDRAEEAVGLDIACEGFCVEEHGRSIVHRAARPLGIVGDMATLDDVRRIASELPGAIEISGKQFAFSVEVKGKPRGFIWTWAERVHPKKARVPNDGVLVVLVPHLEAKQVLLDSDQVKYFTEPHYDGYKAVLVRLEAIELEELEDMIIEAWKCLAPRELWPLAP